MLLDPRIILLDPKMKVYAFVGPSGTGKSYRAQMVANEKGINFIIDDGLLIKDNEVVAGSSAKKAPTKIEENLGLPKISETVYITDVATEEEMQTARRIRVTEGKHVIPVPTFEIKKDFSGYLLDPLQIFKSKGKNSKPYISEKSIIRPTFSYLGNFKISDTVFRQIIEYLATKTPAIHQTNKIRIDNYPEGMCIYVEVVIVYGYNILQELHDFKQKCKREIERLTTMNVESIDIVAKGIKMPEKNSD